MKLNFLKLFFLFSSILLVSCSQFSNAPTSLAWHNTNAKFNKYTIALTNLKEAEKEIDKNKRENYSVPLPIVQPIDSLLARAVEPQLKETIDKASIVAEKHSNSKWLDDSYNLLGRARMLKGDYINAIEVFKYVNSTAKNKLARQQALLFLLQSYTENNDFENGLKVADLLRSLELSKKNTIQYYNLKANLHQKRNEPAIAIAILEESLKLMNKGENKARIHFIAGQIYDLLKNSTKAQYHFGQVKKNKPSYDLEFYSKMNALQNTTSRDANRKKSIQKEFEDLLEDRKNSDLKDKIYFTMGQIEYRNKNYPKAVELYQKSIKATKENKIQAAFSFLELAKINYENLFKYEAAQAYYDSALAFLPETSQEFEQIRRRTRVLNEFVKFQNVIRIEDSLQKVTELNPLMLDKYVEDAIQKMDEEERKLMEIAKKIAQLNANKNGAKQGRWLLYDPTKLNRSKSEFMQIWGTRPLEDNWRRSQKESGAISFKVDKGVVGSEKIEPDVIVSGSGSSKMPLELRKKAMLAELPLNPELMAKSNQKLENAMYRVGKMYYQQLLEPENAKNIFEKLLIRYPATVHEPEVLYFLALLDENGTWKEKIIQKYPITSYARQLQKGSNKTNTADTENESLTNYNSLFELFKSAQLDETLKASEDGLIKYTGTKIEDKYAYIRILTLSKLRKLPEYKSALEEFKQSYPSSNLIKNIKEMQDALN